jgi:hypothetical protein
MKLQEAIEKSIQTDKWFKHSGSDLWLKISLVNNEWITKNGLKTFHEFSPSAILDDYYHMEEEKIEITKSQLLKSFSGGMKKLFEEKKLQYYPNIIEDQIFDTLKYVIKDLGFKE